MIKTASLDISVCQTFATRAKGILGQQPIDSRTAVWLVPCSTVHTFGMREPLSLLFLDRDLKCLKWVTARPNRIYGERKAHSVIEMASRVAPELDLIGHEISDLCRRIDLTEYILVGRIKTGIQDTAKQHIQG